MTLAELIVKLSVQGASAVETALGRTSAGIHAVERASQAGSSGLGKLEEGLRSAARAAGLTALALGAVTAVAAKGLFDEGIRFDRLDRGLQSITGNSKETAAQLDRLRVVAQLPGLGLEEAIEGSINLQAAGLSAKQAEGALTAFGNALATVGKGKADLDGVTLALTQIASKGKVMGQDIMQIQERVPQIRQAMLGAFGTADTEQLQRMGITANEFIDKIVAQLSKLPQVTGGAANSLENLGDKIKLTFLPIGQGLARMFDAAEPALEGVLTRLEPVIKHISDLFNKTANSGVLGDVIREASDGIEHLLGLVDGGKASDAFTHFFAQALSVVANLPTVVGEVGKNIGTAFDILKTDAGEVFRYLEEKGRAAIQVLVIAFQTGIETIKEELSALPSALLSMQSLHFSEALDTLKSAVNPVEQVGRNSILQGAVGDFTGVAAPNLQGLGGLSPLTNLLKDAPNFERRILAASAAPPPLPEHAVVPTVAATGALQKTNGTLEAIERNTAKAADALELRRATYGGGALAQLGATPTELGYGGRRASRTQSFGTQQPNGYAAGPNGKGGDARHVQVSFAPAANDLERAIRKMIDSYVVQTSGAGFRPRQA